MSPTAIYFSKTVYVLRPVPNMATNTIWRIPAEGHHVTRLKHGWGGRGRQGVEKQREEGLICAKLTLGIWKGTCRNGKCGGAALKSRCQAA